MYKHFGDKLVYASSDHPDLTILTSKRPDGALTVIIIHLGTEALSYPLLVDGFDSYEPAAVWRFDLEHSVERDAEQQFDGIVTLTFPPQSITLYVLESGQ